MAQLVMLTRLTYCLPGLPPLTIHRQLQYLQSPGMSRGQGAHQRYTAAYTREAVEVSNIVSTICRWSVSPGRPNRRMVYCSLPRWPWWPWCWPVLAKLAAVIPSSRLIQEDI